MRRTAFVTGGAGFIGSHLSELLLENGWNVKILVRNGEMHQAYNDTVYSEVVDLLRGKGAEIFEGDLKDIKSFSKELEAVDVVFHVAGVAYPYYGLPDEVYFQINTDASVNLAKECEKRGVNRFVYISSIEAAGPSLDGRPLTEESSRNPTDAYGVSKKKSEDFLLELNKNSNMGISIVRPPMTYGERSPLLSRAFNVIKSGYFPMFGKKDAYFEFCYVKNLVYGIYLVGTKEEAIGNVYFISEESYKIIETMREIGREIGNEIRIIRIPKSVAYKLGRFMEILSVILPFYPFRGDEIGSPLFSRKTVDWVTNDQYICSTKKAENQLGYKPKYSRGDGITNIIKWYREKGIL